MIHLCKLGSLGSRFAVQQDLSQERRLREIRKFRTLDGGRSINVGVEIPGKLVLDSAFMFISSAVHLLFAFYFLSFNICQLLLRCFVTFLFRKFC